MKNMRLSFPISQLELKERLLYEPDTGEFYYNKSVGHMKKGLRAGHTNDGGYRVLGIEGSDWLAHRVAWFYMTGRWPTDTIDHIDLNKLNNRFSNLREVSHAENLQNRPAQANSKSGIKGVSWNKPSAKWIAIICVNGRNKTLGRFADIKDAEAAYNKAAAIYHTHNIVNRASIQL